MSNEERSLLNEERTLLWIKQALARGYCSEKNSHKVLDADLIDAMAKEVYDEGNRQFCRVIG